MYGPFTNELLVGRVLKERRRDAFVSTKCGLLVGEQHIVANDAVHQGAVGDAGRQFHAIRQAHLTGKAAEPDIAGKG